MSLRHSLFAVSALAASAALVGCHNDTLGSTAGGPISPVVTGDTVALSASGRVLTLNRGNLAKLVSDLPITGLKSGEQFLGIDIRPQDKLIYGITNQANLYTLDDSTGAATLKFPLSAGVATTATCTGGAPGLFTGLSGTEFAFDFNPVADRLRVASDTRQDLRINVADGKVVVDCPITYMSGTTTGTPRPTAAGYTAATTTTPATTKLFYIDSGSDMLYTIDTSGTDPATMAPNNANNGIIKPVGALGVDVGDINGFDIDNAGTGYAMFTVKNASNADEARFYRIDIATGAASPLVSFAAGVSLRGLALK